MRHFGVFARYWQPGACKTRLASAIGAAAASQLAREFLRLTLRQFHAAADRHELVFTPPDRRQDFEQLAGPQWNCTAQVQGDLGARLQAYFDGAFQAGARQVVVIGSDSPTLPHIYVQQAFAALQEQTVVLGPTDDGGYYLVGTSRPVPELFEQIPWGTPQVFSTTLERLAAIQLPCVTLPCWYDIDHAADLVRLQAELQRPEYGALEWQSLRDCLADLARRSPD